MTGWHIRSRLFAVGVACLTMLPSPADATLLSAEQLMSLCNSSVPSDQTQCAWYVSGLADGAAAVASVRGGDLYCLPDAAGPEVRIDHLLQAIDLYLARHPETGELGAAAVAIVAWHTHFACN